mmetsp:Transcript_29205/g.77095  ORF Transcript_29205/g.77095 Transcript_29205/m.77095 type:complete len:1266 (-) Transcript_29205:87-3884(-)
MADVGSELEASTSNPSFVVDADRTQDVSAGDGGIEGDIPADLGHHAEALDDATKSLGETTAASSGPEHGNRGPLEAPTPVSSAVEDTVSSVGQGGDQSGEGGGHDVSDVHTASSQRSPTLGTKFADPPPDESASTEQTFSLAPVEISDGLSDDHDGHRGQGTASNSAPPALAAASSEATSADIPPDGTALQSEWAQDVADAGVERADPSNGGKELAFSDHLDAQAANDAQTDMRLGQESLGIASSEYHSVCEGTSSAQRLTFGSCSAILAEGRRSLSVGDLMHREAEKSELLGVLAGESQGAKLQSQKSEGRLAGQHPRRRKPRCGQETKAVEVSNQAMQMHVGGHVLVKSQNMEPAIVRFIGETHFSPGEWIGLQLRSPIGRNDGAVDGKRYFHCEPQCGLFVRPAAVVPVSDTDLAIDIEDEDAGTEVSLSEAEGSQCGDSAVAVRVTPGAELRPKKTSTFQRLYANHAQVLRKRLAQQDAARREAEAEEESLIALSARSAPEAVVRASALRLYEQAEARRQRMEERRLELQEKEQELLPRAVKRQFCPPAQADATQLTTPRWELLYDSGMEHMREREQRRRQAVEEEACDAYEQANWRASREIDPEPAFDRLWEDAVRRDLERAERAQEAIDHELTKLQDASVHRGVVVDVQESVERLHAKDVKDREAKRQSLIAQRDAERQRNVRGVDSAPNPARFDLLYSDASRRSEDKRLKAEDHKKKEEMALQMSSVHATAQSQRRRKSDIDQVSSRLHSGKAQASHVRGSGGPTSQGRDSQPKSPPVGETSRDAAYEEWEDGLALEFQQKRRPAYTGQAKMTECYQEEDWRTVLEARPPAVASTKDQRRHAVSAEFVGTQVVDDAACLDIGFSATAFSGGGTQPSPKMQRGGASSVRSPVMHARWSETDDGSSPLARSLLHSAGVKSWRQPQASHQPQKLHQTEARGPHSARGGGAHPELRLGTSMHAMSADHSTLHRAAAPQEGNATGGHSRDPSPCRGPREQHDVTRDSRPRDGPSSMRSKASPTTCMATSSCKVRAVVAGKMAAYRRSKDAGANSCCASGSLAQTPSPGAGASSSAPLRPGSLVGSTPSTASTATLGTRGGADGQAHDPSTSGACGGITAKESDAAAASPQSVGSTSSGRGPCREGPFPKRPVYAKLSARAWRKLEEVFRHWEQDPVLAFFTTAAELRARLHAALSLPPPDAPPPPPLADLATSGSAAGGPPMTAEEFTSVCERAVNTGITEQALFEALQSAKLAGRRHSLASP